LQILNLIRRVDTNQRGTTEGNTVCRNSIPHPSFGIVKSKQPVPIIMEHRSHLPMSWKTRVVGAYAFAFAAVAALVAFLPLGLSGSSSTIASAFLSSLKATYLPPGWIILGLAKSTRLELDAIVSIFVAFLASYPIAAYAVVRLVSPPNLGRRTLAALVVGAAFVFYAGAAWGLNADRYYVISLVPFFFTGFMPIISGYDFYIVMMRGILGWALVFITPVFLLFFFELRRSKGLRWHL